MKKGNTKKIIAILMIVVGLISTIGGFYLNSLDSEDSNKDNNTKNDANANTNTNDTNNPSSTVSDDESITVNKLFEYSGIYSNGTTELTLYVNTTDTIDFSFTSNGSYIGTSLEMDENGKLVYNDSFGFDDEEVSIEITKTDNTITVTSSSSDASSEYNNISGTYTKKEFTNNNWTGYYVFENSSLIIDEYYNKKMNITINKGFSSYSFSVDLYDSETINYTSDTFGDNDIIGITKADSGLLVSASSSDSESMLNEISGTYTKK